ncbi:hypothetical protein BRADI_2g32856v3 [Brachypodium distachyon]|uniref:Uncharacterized protein n=1 Tax=Brachypodium distachyon TaxID=15368 RepID=A0A2K2DBH1_BRADI|nr:hypothetical protein BRADI_2g32856v3 [Brachypodium distachyon]
MTSDRVKTAHISRDNEGKAVMWFSDGERHMRRSHSRIQPIIAGVVDEHKAARSAASSLQARERDRERGRERESTGGDGIRGKRIWRRARSRAPDPGAAGSRKPGSAAGKVGGGGSVGAVKLRCCSRFSSSLETCCKRRGKGLVAWTPAAGEGRGLGARGRRRRENGGRTGIGTEAWAPTQERSEREGRRQIGRRTREMRREKVSGGAWMEREREVGQWIRCLRR